jgi:hypothetical protein
MNKKAGTKRTERIIVLYTEEEFARVKKHFARSTSRTMAGYVRKVSLEEPVEITVRNASFDAFIDEIMVLRKEMAACSKESLVELHVEIKNKINKIVELCMPQ